MGQWPLTRAPLLLQKVPVSEMEGGLKTCLPRGERSPGCDGDSKNYRPPFFKHEPVDPPGIDNGVLRKVLHKDIYKILMIEMKRHDCSDFQVMIGDETIDCYRIVLRHYSPIFQRNSSSCCINKNVVEAEQFKEIYKWMCDQKTFEEIANPSTIVDIIKVSQKLNMEVLEDLSTEYLENSKFTEEEAFYIYAKASLHKLSYVRDMMYKRIKKSFMAIVSTKEFLELDVGSLCFLLKSPYLEAESELEVFYSAVRWLSHKWSERRKHVFNVMACILLSHLPAWKLVDLSRNSPSPEVIKVLRQDALQFLLNNSIEESMFREDPKFIGPLKFSGSYYKKKCTSGLITDYDDDKLVETYEEFTSRIESLQLKSCDSTTLETETISEGV